MDVATRRLHAQRLAGTPFTSPVEAVRWLGAVQSQDYAGARWALGLRTRGVFEADLDRLFDEGAILRTHVMRPTWHFVLPDDVRWLLELTAPRVKATLAHYDRQLGIDADLLRRSQSVMVAALRDGEHRTRSELAAALERSGIVARGQRLGHLVMHAELDGVVASGPRRGRQFTYALLEERAPGARRLDRDEALAELARRYFTGHGPAQLPDFAWWSGLTSADARRGVAMAGGALVQEAIGGKTHWSSPDESPAATGEPIVHLLPNFDEFLVAYRDRTASLEAGRELDAALFRNGSVLDHVVLVNGRVRGGWRRSLSGNLTVIEIGLLAAPDDATTDAIRRAADDYGRFLGCAVTVNL